MGTPPKESILDNFQTTLEGITIANGYKTDVETVERLIKEWHSVGAGLRAWVGYMPQVSTFKYYAFGQLRVTMPIIVAAHVNAATKALASEAITNIEDDILAAISADTTRGGFATMTHLISQQDDIGDPDSIDSQGAGGTLTMTFNVVYHRDGSLS